MKTPEEIKKGLKECGKIQNVCDSCPYNEKRDVYDECIANMCADALAYIQQLEQKGRDDG